MAFPFVFKEKSLTFKENANACDIDIIFLSIFL